MAGRVADTGDVLHLGSSQKMSWVPLPWWKSTSTTATPAPPGWRQALDGGVEQAEAAVAGPAWWPGGRQSA